MSTKDKIDFEIGHNEETFEFFTKHAKLHKEKIRKQDELMKNVPSIEKLDITEVHMVKVYNEYLYQQEQEKRIKANQK